MTGFHIVCILVSEINPTRHYTGLTEDLGRRLKAHSSGQVPHTAAHRPWRIGVFVAFQCRGKAIAFENYLKSLSGRAFARRHL